MKFKIGTLDQLMKLNDALAKVDTNLEGVIRKIEKQGLELDSSFEFQAVTRDGNSNRLTLSRRRRFRQNVQVERPQVEALQPAHQTRARLD